MDWTQMDSEQVARRVIARHRRYNDPRTPHLGAEIDLLPTDAIGRTSRRAAEQTNAAIERLCPQCEGMWAETSYRRNPRQRGLVMSGQRVIACPSCRTKRIIRETCESMGGKPSGDVRGNTPLDIVTPVFQGDPRGATVRLAIAGQPLDVYDRAALAVPTS